MYESYTESVNWDGCEILSVSKNPVKFGMLTGLCHNVLFLAC